MADEIIAPSQRPSFDYSIPRLCRKCQSIFSGRGCTICKNVARNARRDANREEVRRKENEYRATRRDHFNAKDTARRNSWTEDKIAAVKVQRTKYYTENRDSLLACAKEYRHKNRARILVSAAAHRTNSKAATKARAAKYRRENPEKVKAQFASWVAANPDANRIRVQNRRAIRIRDGGKLSNGLAAKLFRLQRGKCACCRAPLGRDYNLDHITPLSRGGRNIDSNMQLLTRLCNMQKHAADPIDFMRQRGFLL